MACKHAGKPNFSYEFKGDTFHWAAWCTSCGEEWGGESPDPLAIFEEWMVE